MNILTVCGVGVCGALLFLLLRRENPEFAVLGAFCCGAMILLAVLPSVREVFGFAEEVSGLSGLSGDCPGILLKALAVAYITQFSADACRDCGQSGVAGKIALAGKISILVLSFPLVRQIIEAVRTFR